MADRGKPPIFSFARVCVLVLVALIVGIGPAHAYPFARPLRQGHSGRDVHALQVRVAGWFSKGGQRRFAVDGHFDHRTTKAVKALQRRYHLTVDGIAGPQTFEVLNRLEDSDGSTAHFNWGEFRQNRNASCSKRANRYAGTFKGGRVGRRIVKRNVHRIMWRLEALRKKTDSRPIVITSGFRSVPYNTCINGASRSQHLYGTAVDLRIARVNNRRSRNVAKKSQFQGIGCYSEFTHNHFDLRIENRRLPEERHWWWPERDEQGRDLDYTDRPCWGERGGAGSSKGDRRSAVRGPLTPWIPLLAPTIEPSNLYGLD